MTRWTTLALWLALLPTGCSRFHPHRVTRTWVDWNSESAWSLQRETFEKLPPFPERVMLTRWPYNVAKPAGSAPAMPVSDEVFLGGTVMGGAGMGPAGAGPWPDGMPMVPTNLDPAYGGGGYQPAPVAPPLAPPSYTEMRPQPPQGQSMYPPAVVEPPILAPNGERMNSPANEPPAELDLDDILRRAAPPSWPDAGRDAPPAGGAPPGSNSSQDFDDWDDEPLRGPVGPPTADRGAIFERISLSTEGRRGSGRRSVFVEPENLPGLIRPQPISPRPQRTAPATPPGAWLFQ